MVLSWSNKDSKNSKVKKIFERWLEDNNSAPSSSIKNLQACFYLILSLTVIDECLNNEILHSEMSRFES